MPSRLSATKIRAKMKAQNISPTAMARLTSLSPSTVDRVINGRATGYNDHTAERFANALGCTVFEILDDEYVAPAITTTIASSFETGIVGAVTEAVTVVVDDVAPKTPSGNVAETIPDMTVHLPQALDVAAYFTTIQEDHKSEIERIKEAHKEHLNDIRKEKNAWRMVALVSIAVTALDLICFFLFR